jgi:hypothetical protein
MYFGAAARSVPMVDDAVGRHGLEFTQDIP